MTAKIKDTLPCCDLVMEGGGVKGIGLVGALSVLDKKGYSFRRVGGTSAGAIVGSLVAAGVPISKLQDLLETLDYRQFRDESGLDKFGLVGKTASLVFEKGIYEGRYLHAWLSGQLQAVGVTTFKDLRIEDEWAKDLPPEQRYRLVVIVSDISRAQLIRLPWDYAKFGLDPDTQPVADAVRASMSIPFFFEPARLGGDFMVDGGMLSNFPIDLFASTPQWPTFGMKLSAKPESVVLNPVKTIVDFVHAVVETAMSGHDQMHLDDPAVLMRTMFIDTTNIKATNFDISPEQQQALFQNGRKAAEKFLKDWNFAAFQKAFPGK